MSVLFLLTIILSVATMSNGMSTSSSQSKKCKENENEKDCTYFDRATWASCWVYGDPHFITFDNYHYRFGGEGAYCLVDGCDATDLSELGDLRIGAIIQPRPKNVDQFRIKALVIYYGGYIYDIWYHTVFCIPRYLTGTWVVQELPYDNGEDGEDKVCIFKVGNSIIIWLGTNVRIEYRHKFRKVHIWIKRSVFRADVLCGLCGRFNGDAEDDPDCSVNYNEDKLGEGEDPGSATCTIAELGEQWGYEDEDLDAIEFPTKTEIPVIAVPYTQECRYEFITLMGKI